MPQPRFASNASIYAWAASILIQDGEVVASLADLVGRERFKKILRYYHHQANRQPNAFVIGVAKTLIQVAQYHAGATSEEVGALKRVASNLPAVPFDLTAKNKTLLRQLESDRLRAKLYFLPEQLIGEVAKDLERGRVRFVEAEVAIAIDILLASPLRPQNLSSLSWQQHFTEPKVRGVSCSFTLPPGRQRPNETTLSVRSLTKLPADFDGIAVTYCRAWAPT